MMKIPCEIIKDLLPLYIDGLTSDVTSREIEDHVLSCTGCKDILESMKKETSGFSRKEAQEEKKQIDFLKKYRSRIRITALSVVLAILALVLGVLFTRSYLIGQKCESGSVTYSIEVKDQQIHVTAEPVNEKDAICELHFEESSDGFLWITSRKVESSLFHSGGKSTVYTWKSEEPLTMIFVDAERRIVWDEGEEISFESFEIWGTKHRYVGDMSSNVYTANKIGIREKIGSFTNELQTESEPYGWTIIFSEPLDKKMEKYYRSEMKKSAFEMIALIENLDHVSFRYEIDGKEYEDMYTYEQANGAFGGDVKESAESPKQFQELMRVLSVEP